METRKVRIMVCDIPGKNACNYRIALPAPWMRILEITKDSRNVTLSFDGRKITIERDEEETK